MTAPDYADKIADGNTGMLHDLVQTHPMLFASIKRYGAECARQGYTLGHSAGACR